MKEKRRDVPLSGCFWSQGMPYDGINTKPLKQTKHWLWAIILCLAVMAIAVLPRFFNLS